MCLAKSIFTLFMVGLSSVGMAKTVIVKEGGRIFTKQLQDSNALADRTRVVTSKAKMSGALRIANWSPLTSETFRWVGSNEKNAPLLQFQCGMQDAEIKVVKSISGKIILRKDAQVKLTYGNAKTSSVDVFLGEQGRASLEFLNQFWLACRNAGVHYQAELEDLIREVTPRLNQKNDYGYAKMPEREKLVRIFSIPKGEIFKKWQRKLCKQHQVLSSVAPKSLNWKAEPCYSQ